MHRLQELIDAAAAIVHTKAELARRLGVSRQRLNDWRSGAAPCPPHAQYELATIAGQDPVVTLGAIAVEKLGKALASVIAGAVVSTLFLPHDAAAALCVGAKPTHDNV